MSEAVIVSTARTPIGRAFKGSLAQVRPDDLTAGVIDAALAKLGEDFDRSQLDDILVGCAEPSHEQGGNLARRVGVQLGLDTVPGTTVNRFCASSVQTAAMAFHAIAAGEGDAFISAGVESVSRYRQFFGAGEDDPAAHNPLFGQARERTARQGDARWSDPREQDELPDIYVSMGQTAENVAALRGISRAEQDEYAVRSQSLAAKAIEEDVFAREIAPVRLPDGTLCEADESPRPGTTVEKIAQLPTPFLENGTVSAGNCTPLSDGAAAVVIMSSTRAEQLGLTPLARIVATGASALSPEIMGLGPVGATRQALGRAGMTIDDIDLVEINEAFASQVIASQRELGIDLDRLNVHGGAIALGHPFGSTGARIMTTLINAMQLRDAQFGLETMCVGGGQGMAIILERLS